MQGEAELLTGYNVFLCSFVCVFSCRLILVCESLSKVIPPLRSRCLPIRVPAPQTTEVRRNRQTSTHTYPLADERLLT